MMRWTSAVAVFLLCAGLMAGADPAAPTVGKILDSQLSMVEHEFVLLAEAMPEDKYGFAPTGGEFKGVRTFSQQVSHTAAVIYVVAAAVLQEKSPADPGKDENGPDSLKTKDDVVKYLKGAFEYAHKAMKSLTSENATGLVPSAFGEGKVSRLWMASVAIWHSFDHYGQMVVYARMNGIIPPASRGGGN